MTGKAFKRENREPTPRSHPNPEGIGFSRSDFITEQKRQAVKMPFTAEECKRVAAQLEDMRLHMKSQICKTAQEKCAQIKRDDKLANARALLSKIAKWIEGDLIA